MTEPIRPLDHSRLTIPPVEPVPRGRRTNDEREPEAEDRERERREREPSTGDDPGEGHIDVLA